MKNNRLYGWGSTSNFQAKLKFSVLLIAAISGFIFTACDNGTEKSASVKTAALEAKIAEATTEKNLTQVAYNAAQVEEGQKWVTQEVMDVFEAAIDAAQAAHDLAASQKTVNAAVTKLAAAIQNFKNEQDDGTYTGTSSELIAFANSIAALEQLISDAQALSLLIFVDTAAGNVPLGANWVLREVMDIFEAAITSARNALVSAETKEEVDSMLEVLDDAIKVFTGEFQEGEKESGFSSEDVASLILMANTEKDGVVTSANNGDDVSPNVYWVSESALSALNGAIDTLQNASGQSAVDAAYLALIKAVGVFSKKHGTTPDKNALHTLITASNAYKDNVATAANEAAAPSGSAWATPAQHTAIQSAITNAAGVYNDHNATKMGVDAAKAALETAYNTFTSAVTLNGPGSGGGQVWVDPATQTTQLTGGTVLTPPQGGNNNLSGSPYGYEVFLYDSNADRSTNKMTWYGANQGGGGAYRVDWTGYILARLGYYWGNGGKYTQYHNIYIDYNFNRSANDTAPSGGYIGAYGWSRNPSAIKPVERLIEYYIVDDWFWDGQLNTPNLYQTYTKEQIANKGETLNSDLGAYVENGNDVTFGKELGSFEVNGATYKLYMTTRVKEGCIDYPPNYEGTFIQLFSVRQGRRSYGTISVTEHFKAWSRYIELGNLYEAKFKVEAMNFTGDPATGYLDLTYLYLSQEAYSRGGNTVGAMHVDYDPDSEVFVSSHNAYAPYANLNNLSSSVSYQIVNLPKESRTEVMKVEYPSGDSAALYDLAEYKDRNVTVTFSAKVKRVGAAGTLNWQINNSSYPSVGSAINNAAVNTWHSMGGTWTGTPTAAYPSLYLSTYQNSSDVTTYYIHEFTITVTPAGSDPGSYNYPLQTLADAGSGYRWVTSANGIINRGQNTYESFASQWDGVEVNLEFPVEFKLSDYSRITIRANYYNKDKVQIASDLWNIAAHVAVVSTLTDWGNNKIVTFYNLGLDDGEPDNLAKVLNCTINRDITAWNSSPAIKFVIQKADAATAASGGMAFVEITELKFHN